MRRDGKRLREAYTRTEEEAKGVSEKWSIEAGNTGAATAAALSDTEKQFLVEARDSLLPYGKTLRDALAFYLEHLQSQHSSKPVRHVIDALLAHRQKKGKSERYRQDLRQRLTRFDEAFEGRIIGQISSEEVETWLDSLQVAAVTRNNFRRLIHVLWSFAVSKRWAESNAVTSIEAQTVQSERPGILTIAQTRAILTTADPAILPYLAIALFGGLRDAELKRLDWRDVSLLTNYIRISAAVSKNNRERLVPIPENLKAWLQPIAKARGPVTPDNWRPLLLKAREAAEIEEWPHDATRHSFGTYLMADKKDIGLTSEVMGNSPAIVQRHYKAAVPFEQGPEYFAIAPAGSNIIRMTPAA